MLTLLTCFPIFYRSAIPEVCHQSQNIRSLLSQIASFLIWYH